MSLPQIDPAMLPPPENRGHVYFGVLVGLGIPSLIAIAMRTFVRIKYTKMWWDDYLMLVVVPLLISNHGLSLASIRYGIGQHLLRLNPLDAMEAARLNTIAQPLNVWALFFVKASIVLFLVRLKPGKVYLFILWSTFALLVAVTIEIFVVIMAQCQPIARAWNPTITTGFCWSPNVFTYSAYFLSAVTVVTDVVYIVIPIFFLWNVQLNRRVKYAIWAVLGLGIISMACSIATIPYIYQLTLSADPTYTIVDLAALKSGELNVAILCACMPPMQPLFKRTGELISNFSRASRATQSDASSRLPKNESWESRQKTQFSAHSKYGQLSSTSEASVLKSHAGDMPSSTSMASWKSTTNSRHNSTVVAAGEYQLLPVANNAPGVIVRTTDVTLSYV